MRVASAPPSVCPAGDESIVRGRRFERFPVSMYVVSATLVEAVNAVLIELASFVRELANALSVFTDHCKRTIGQSVSQSISHPSCDY